MSVMLFCRICQEKYPIKLFFINVIYRKKVVRILSVVVTSGKLSRQWYHFSLSECCIYVYNKQFAPLCYCSRSERLKVIMHCSLWLEISGLFAWKWTSDRRFISESYASRKHWTTSSKIYISKCEEQQVWKSPQQKYDEQCNVVMALYCVCRFVVICMQKYKTHPSLHDINHHRISHGSHQTNDAVNRDHEVLELPSGYVWFVQHRCDGANKCKWWRCGRHSNLSKVSYKFYYFVPSNAASRL